MNDKLRNIKKIAQYAPHRVYAVMLVGIAVLIPTIAIFAYGPERPTYTIENPADHVTFNSITNNPNYGDERNFLLVKDAANTSAGGWSHTDINVEPGKEYLVRLYVHNNAQENLNLVSENTRVSANVPTTTGNQVQIDGFITSDNASPQKVWDDVVLKSDKRFNVAYVPGSTTYYNNVNPNPGFNLPDSIVTNSGALVGYQQMDGKVPGCFKFSGVATFKVKIQGEATANFEATKQVRKHTDQKGGWSKSVEAKPGDSIDYMVTYRNTGQTQQDNVTIKDSLPAATTYTAGSSKLTTTQTPNGAPVSDNVTKPSGINIGSYAPTGTAYTTFTAKVGQESELPKCGNNVLRNTATVETDNGTKSDYADVIVNKNCAQSYSCDALQATKITQLEYKFDVKLSAKDATAKEVTIDFGDGQKATRDANTPSVSHTYAQAGQYNIKATATFEVDGKTIKDVTSDACQTVINTEATVVTPTGTTPTELPSTGPVEVFVSLIAFGALGLGIQQWIASRRAVSEALQHKI